jgi:hypothetical protein
MSQRDEFLTQLLADKTPGPKGPLIQEVGGVSSANKDHEQRNAQQTSGEEGPSLMELMMAAHQEAKVEKEASKAEEVKKTTKTFGSGFKKGFFGGGGGKSSSTGSNNKATQAAPVAKPGRSGGVETVPVVKKNPNPTDSTTTRITEEVQRAMKEEESPLLGQLRQGGTSS